MLYCALSYQHFLLAEEHKNKVPKKPGQSLQHYEKNVLFYFTKLTELDPSKCIVTLKLKCSQKYAIEIY